MLTKSFIAHAKYIFVLTVIDNFDEMSPSTFGLRQHNNASSQKDVQIKHPPCLHYGFKWDARQVESSSVLTYVYMCVQGLYCVCMFAVTGDGEHCSLLQGVAHGDASRGAGAPLHGAMLLLPPRQQGASLPAQRPFTLLL